MTTISLKTAVSILSGCRYALVDNKYLSVISVADFRDSKSYDDYFAICSLELYGIRNAGLYVRDNQTVTLDKDSLIFTNRPAKKIRVTPLYPDKFLEFVDYGANEPVSDKKEDDLF